MSIFKKHKGFTLLELLIVIAIIGILTVALLPVIRGGPSKARDAQRQAMVNNIVKSLEVLNSETGAYPASGINADNSVRPCLTDLAKAPEKTIDPKISSGLPLKGPSATPANLCASNAYFYKLFANDGYIVAAEVENCGSSNVAGADPVSVVSGAANTAVVDTKTAVSATTKCVFAVVQKVQ